MNKTENKRQNLKRMKLLAVSLLLFMTLVFITSHILEKQNGIFSYLKAMAEASMIGALADWFAVVALFKKPLGFPFHTAIIPRNKDRIGLSLAGFVKENFLTRSVLSEKIGTVDITGISAKWLSDKNNVKLISGIFAEYAPAIIDKFDDKDVSNFIRENLLNTARRIKIAPVIGSILEALTSGNMHNEIFIELLKKLKSYLEDDNIKKLAEKEDDFFLKKLGKRMVFGMMRNNITSLLDDIINDPAHKMRNEFNLKIKEFIYNLKNSEEYIAKGEEIKEQLLNSEEAGKYIGNVWLSVKIRIKNDLAGEDSVIKNQIENIISGLSKSLAGDETVSKKINKWLSDFIIEFISGRAEWISSLISDTVKKWDAKEMSQKLETEIGSDLQYIRINGTIIGGIAGLAIFTISKLF
jgi:uncharacterized membrane-anchored protein YjiN (DUF445 family)